MRSRHIDYLSLLLATCIASSTFAQTQSSVVPGFTHAAKLESKGVDPGEMLVGELNCIACHRADAATARRLNSKQAPLLKDVGKRITPQYLYAYLSDLHGVKPGITMPDIFHKSNGPRKDMAVDFLVHFLVSQGGPVPESQSQASDGVINEGRRLFHRVGCVACHAPQEKATEFGFEAEFGDVPEVKTDSIPLPKRLAEKTTVEQLANFLLDPHKTRPAGRMPSLNLARDEATAIAMYLLRDQAPDPDSETVKLSKVRGLKQEYYTGGWGKLPDFDKLKPKKSDMAATPTVKYAQRRDNFAYRWSGYITIPRDGDYIFFTSSDDGSALYINDTMVVNNDGIHGAAEKSGRVRLTKGDHAFRATFFEKGGQESMKVSWQGPGINKQELPASAFSYYARAMHPVGGDGFKLDPQKAQMGSRMFAAMRCAACHTGIGKPMSLGKPLAKLKLNSEFGCIGTDPAQSAPKYSLSKAQRAAIRQTLSNVKSLAKPHSNEEQIARTMATLNCYACHERGKIGGSEDGRDAFFFSIGQAELGDEGRVPPSLDGVGAKLRTKALEGVLFRGESVRPYMAVRMPKFGEKNVGHLVAAFEKADGSAGDLIEPEFEKSLVKQGRKLVGAKALGCVNCHNVAGNRSLGVPAVDLALMHSRVKPGWFFKFLTNPIGTKPGTRMPTFWPKGKPSAVDKVFNGDMRKQQEAIWAYLSMGKSIPLPQGIHRPSGGSELTPYSEPIIFRTFMTDVSPRAITVGFPDQLHFAFDANVVRLAKAWRGKFFDPSGTWNGRAGKFNGPLGTDVINMPAGPAFAILKNSTEAWPAVAKNDRNKGGDFRGYRLDEELRPIFVYDLGGWRIEEQPLPELKAGGAVLTRKLNLRAAGSKAATLYFLAAAGKISKEPDGSYLVDDKLSIKLKTSLAPQVRTSGGSGGRQELIVPIKANATASIEVEMSW